MFLNRYHLNSPLWLYGASILYALAFLGLAWGVHQNSWFVGVDHAIAVTLASTVSPTVLWLLSWFTYLGDRHFLTGFAVALVLVLFLQREWWDGLACVVITAGCGLLTRGVKHLIERVRPEHLHGYVSEAGWSFPSGHSSASAAVYGFTCYVALRYVSPRWRWLCIAITGLLILSIGLSRVVLQVHYVSDVIAGFCLAGFWMALCFGVLSSRHRKHL